MGAVEIPPWTDAGAGKFVSSHFTSTGLDLLAGAFLRIVIYSQHFLPFFLFFYYLWLTSLSYYVYYCSGCDTLFYSDAAKGFLLRHFFLAARFYKAAHRPMRVTLEQEAP